jgi:hypothetical protein
MSMYVVDLPFLLPAMRLKAFQTEAHCAVLAEAAYIYISAQSAAGSITAAGKAVAVGLVKNKVLKIYSIYIIQVERWKEKG